MKATRPLEFVHFGAIPLTTRRDGTVYAFLAVDAYSKYVFTLGVDKNLTDLSVLFHIKQLLSHTNFKTPDPSFTLILSAGEHLVSDIKKLIGPSNKVVVDAKMAMQEIEPVTAAFLDHMASLKDNLS